MTLAFWRGRRVLVTGHTGFKGSWLALWLHRLGAEVTGYALPAPTEPSLFELAGIEQLMHHNAGDVGDIECLRRVVDQARPEIVFHLAAQSLVRQSLERPVETYVTNVIGTAHVLEVVRHAPDVRAVVIVTSDKCYAKSDAPHAESDPLGGDDPYSSSKAGAELVTAAYRASFFNNRAIGIASARAGNVIGGGDWARHRLIPDIITALLRNEPMRLRSPRAIRPWQHVLDPLHGYLLLAEGLFAGQRELATAWNFGPSEERDVRGVAEQFLREWGGGALEIAPEPGSVEAPVLRIDSSAARRALGWRPRVPFDTALSWTVEWYRGYVDGLPPRELAARDLARFESLA
jgi:CDP-glucose 4,6-dehydratase